MYFLIKTYILFFIASAPFIYVALFIAMTPQLTSQQRWDYSRKACHIALLILLITGIFGIKFLALLGVNLNAFRIAGGIVIGGMGLQILKNVPKTFQIFSEQMLIVPLAFPMISGPGAISATLIAQASAQSFQEYLLVILAIFLIMATYYVLFYIAAWSSKFLSHFFFTVFFKLSSIILLTFSVNLIFNGINGLIHQAVQ